jgi:ribosomal protein L24E
MSILRGCRPFNKCHYNAIALLEKNPDKIHWASLSANPNAIHLLEKNPDKIHWSILSGNPSIFEPEYEYEALKERCHIYKEELIQITMHPSRIQKLLYMGISIAELDNYL